MCVHVHICYFCEESEEVEGPSARKTLPEKWKWLTRRRGAPNAVAVCPRCWKEKWPEIVMARIRGGQVGSSGSRRGCCN